jgi:hypothetical protein
VGDLSNLKRILSIPPTFVAKYPKVLEKGIFQAGKATKAAWIDPKIRSHGSAVFKNTVPKLTFPSQFLDNKV